MLPLGKNPGWGSGHGHIPLGHGQITKNGRITLFFIFGPSHLFFKSRIFLDIFWKALDLGYRINSKHNLSSRVFTWKIKKKLKRIFIEKPYLSRFGGFIEIFNNEPKEIIFTY